MLATRGRRMCDQSCSFLWGGTGVATHDDDGGCFCVCGNDSWSSLNILGGASCVPVKAHRIFGWVGVAVSVAALGHAAYHLREQLEFHRQTTSASNSPVEKCRWQLHIAAGVLATVSILYFSLVVDNRLRWSAFVWVVMQISTYIAGAVLAVRMWIYTNDARLMQKSPTLLAISNWLETRTGHCVLYGLVSIAPIASMFIELATDIETTFMLISIGICIITAMGMATFWVCGRSLVNAIDASLQQNRDKQQQQLQASSAAGAKETNSRKGSYGDLTLLAARKKVKIVLTFVMCSGTTTEFFMLFGVYSGYGAKAPLVLLVAPLAISAPMWYGVNIQVHAGRSSASGRNLSRRVTLPAIGPTHGRRSGRPSSLACFGIRSSRASQTRLLPTEGL